ncbi:MAG: ABC transporter permease [Methanobacterium sp.]|nr:ABC transporter permease [Methanobacterium sp.]
MVVNNIIKHRFLLNFNKYKYLLTQLVKRDVKVKYRNSVLGIFWSFLNPLLMMVVMTIIFSTLFGKTITNFPVYYLTGILIFTLFSKGSSGAMTSITKNSAMLNKIYIPKYMYVLSVVISNLVTFVFSLFILIFIMIATGAPFTIYIFFGILPILLVVIITIGAGLLLATLNVFFRDIQHLYKVFITLLMYGSAIFYPIDIVPVQFQIFYLNPLFAIITLFRDSFYSGIPYDLFNILYASLFSILILILGVVIFYKTQDKFILHL